MIWLRGVGSLGQDVCSSRWEIVGFLIGLTSESKIFVDTLEVRQRKKEELKIHPIPYLEQKLLWMELNFQQWFFNRILLFSSVQSLSCVQLFVNPWTEACQASLSITNSWSLLKLMSIESVMPSNHLILCRPLLLQPSIFPSIRVFSNEPFLHIRWPQYWSFSFCISPSNEYSGLISFTMDWLDLLAVQAILLFTLYIKKKLRFF